MLTVVIPMAGEGSRFRDAGYDVPKPLIRIGEKTMVEAVVDNISSPEDRVVLIARREHREALMDSSIWLRPNVTFRFLDEKTEGTACTVLTAADLIDTPYPLIIANSDQFIDYDRAAWLRHIYYGDSSMMTFRASDPKWSYARQDRDGFVTQVAEKRVISDWATCGVYFFKRGESFCAAARRMIQKELRVNGEFYTCPVFNELVAESTVSIFPVREMLGLGTPEDLQAHGERVEALLWNK